MKYRTLGQTGLEVSEIGLGAFPISGTQQRVDGSIEVWSGTSDAESIALIHRCEELGVNLIDSAEGYGDGHSEELVGQALQGRRDKRLCDLYWIIPAFHASLPAQKTDNKLKITQRHQICHHSHEKNYIAPFPSQKRLAQRGGLDNSDQLSPANRILNN